MTVRPTVLLVDDDPQLLDALRRRLRHEPYTIRVAAGPLPALRMLDEAPVDVVVSDEEMPAMRGTDFLAAVHARHAETIRIILTGRANLATAIRVINRGAVYRFFTKPCDADELAIAIRQGLQQQALLRQSRRLLHTVRRQSAEIQAQSALTSEHVKRDASGAVVLEDGPIDLEALLAEMEIEIDAADARMQRNPAESSSDPAPPRPRSRHEN